MRNEYRISIHFNNRFFSKVIIDQHYKISHPEMTDELILDLVRNIRQDVFTDSTHDLYKYYKVEPVYFLEKPYRLILLIEKDAEYLGVVNAFRVRRTNAIPKPKRNQESP